LAKIFFDFHAQVHFARIENCQNGTFEHMHEIRKIFWPKDLNKKFQNNENFHLKLGGLAKKNHYNYR
jgi:hypothetical protein